MRKIIYYLLALLFLSNIAISAQESLPIFYQEFTWSPDGKAMSFTTYRKPDPNSSQLISEVYIMKADGTGLQKVAERAGWSSWSKDGKRIAFSRPGEDRKSVNIFTVKTDGSGLIQLTNNANRNSHPAFSPDGKKIAFISERGNEKAQIYVMNADGSGVEKLTIDEAVSCNNPAWSPDSKKLVYYVEKGDNKDQVWTMNADGSNPTLLTNNVGHNIYPAWIPGGREITFASSRDGEDVAIYKIKADGSGIQRMPGMKSFYARYSPNGKKIIFIFGRFPKNDVFISDADGSNIQKLSPK